MMRYGLEKEYFLKKGDKFVLVPASYPADECQWLLELRTKPHTSIEDAVDELLLLEYKMVRELESKGYRLIESPVEVLPQDLVRKALAQQAKPIPAYQNYLGHEYHNVKQGEKTASVHISFTDQEEIVTPDYDFELHLSNERGSWVAKNFTELNALPLQGGSVSVKKIKLPEDKLQKKTINRAFDYLSYFITLDKNFKKEIEDASRVPGMYEFKVDGRIEYRSLPNNIDLYKLAKVVKSVKTE